VFLAESIQAVIDVLARKLRRPKMTIKALLIILITLVLTTGLVALFLGFNFTDPDLFRLLLVLLVFSLILSDINSLAVLFLLIVLPQFILYNKTGFQKRFCIPGFLGFSFLLVYLWDMIGKDKRVGLFAKRIFLALIVLIFLPKLGHTYFRVKVLAEEGIQTNRFLEEVIDNTEKGTNILIVIDPVTNNEALFAMKTYLAHRGRPECYLMPASALEPFYDGETVEGFGENVYSGFNGRILTGSRNARKFGCIAVFPRLEKAFLTGSSAWFSARGYTRKVFSYFEGDFVLYCGK